jgi:hypothetical protein
MILVLTDDNRVRFLTVSIQVMRNLKLEGA